MENATGKTESRMVISLLLLLLATPGSVMADGCMLAPEIYEIYEPHQLAFIQYDDDQQMEHLHIMPKFYGDALEFAWIVPTPTLPEVSTSDRRIFDDCARLSAAVYRNRDDVFNCEGGVYSADDGAGNLEVISEELVGIYQTMILRADEVAVLIAALTSWGFLPPGGDDEFTEVLDHYVSRDWFFVAMKVDPAAIDDMDPHYDGYYYGAIDPMEFSFATDEIVYPLRISQISAAPSSDVTLYVAASSKTTFAGATTRYANRMTDEELSYIRRDHPYVGELLSTGDFLTKLQRHYTPSQMDADIILQPAENNDEFRQINYSGLPVTTGLFMLATLAYGAWSIKRAARSRRHGGNPQAGLRKGQ